MHRSAWKVNSQKFGCSVVHRSPCLARRGGSPSVQRTVLNPAFCAAA